MLSLSSAALGLILAFQVQGHAIITPALGGGTARSDVKLIFPNAPCGLGVDIASAMSNTQAIPVTNGAIQATITNFNGLLDGSREVTAKIDPTGTGQNFQEATVTTNGDRVPLDVGSQPLEIQVPAGMQSTNGMMLISLKTASGIFGNCIAASDGAATGASNSTTTSTGTETGTGSTATTGAETGTGNTATGTGTGTGTETETGAAQGAGTATGAGAATGEEAGAATGAQAPAAANPVDAIKAKLQKIKTGQRNKIRDARSHIIH